MHSDGIYNALWMKASSKVSPSYQVTLLPGFLAVALRPGVQSSLQAANSGTVAIHPSALSQHISLLAKISM